MPIPIMVYNPKLDRSVNTGMLHGKTYCRYAPQSDVMKQTFPGSIGISSSIIDILKGSGCEYVALNVAGVRDHVYISRLEQWSLSGLKADFGNGEKTCLPIQHMRVMNREGFNPQLLEANYAQYPFA